MFYKAASEGYRTVIEGVDLKTLVHGERTLLTEVRLRGGAVVPMHDHSQEQTGYIVSGRLRFIFEDETLVAEPGDSWNIAADVPHGAEALEDSVVVEVFSPVREDYLDDAAS